MRPAAAAEPTKQTWQIVIKGHATSVIACAHYLCVRSVRAKLIEYEWIQQIHVTGHLLHTTQLALFFGVSKLNDQTG